MQSVGGLFSMLKLRLTFNFLLKKDPPIVCELGKSTSHCRVVLLYTPTIKVEPKVGDAIAYSYTATLVGSATQTLFLNIDKLLTFSSSLTACKHN
jgi:hypothetical protein